MPEETLPQPEQPQDEEGWRRIAEDAAAWPEDHEGLQAFRENHVNRVLGEKGLHHLVVDKDTKAGARFLSQHGKVDQQEIDNVVGYMRQNGAAIPDKAGDRTAHYLSFLADKDYANDGILTGNQTSIERQIDAHVIKADKVPESYFEFQRRIAREQGHGDVEITPDMRRQIIEAAQADQRGSLEKWVEYLGGDDGSYPDWFKRYTWNSVTRLGQYNKEAGKFGKRDETTVAPYPELNREALAYVYDTVKKFHVLGEEVEDTELKNLLKEGSFGKLYAHSVLAVAPDNPELKNSIEGSWTIFHQTHDPRTARRLSGSLQGHGTGWCTAGESTATAQLGEGDFYVYYTRDEDNKDTVPRVAIRMQGGEVAEVRGVNPAQELEPVMADIASSQLTDLPGGEEYIRRAEDMKRLTAIDNLMKENPDLELSKADVKFLYELYQPIEGFGYERDPRIDEIRQKRGKRDHENLKVVSVEHLHEVYASSINAYRRVIEQLDKASVPNVTDEELHSLFDAQLEEWQERGVLDYVAERLVTHGEVFTPVITPNTLADYEDIKRAAEDFGEGQPHETYIYEPLYSKYSAEELSGVLIDGKAVRFSLIPSKVTEELGYGTVESQQQKLLDMQLNRPKLNFHVPSVLTAISHWYTLRDWNVVLKRSGTSDRTWIRHFNLNPQRLDGWSYVPYSNVIDFGEPYLSDSVADLGIYARVAVG